MDKMLILDLLFALSCGAVGSLVIWNVFDAIWNAIEPTLAKIAKAIL